MNRYAIVVTHHKTGTAWMQSTFEAICGNLKIPFFNLLVTPIQTAREIGSPVVVFDPFAVSGSAGLADDPERRAFHLIRDPRDVVISAMHFHRVADEKWLHLPTQEFGGLTYQQKLNSLTDDRTRYLFEMDNSGGRVTNAMRRWNYGRANCMECKYEDLIDDDRMLLFTSIATHLGFSGEELEECRARFWQCSIFGGKKHRIGMSRHLRSGDVRQWPKVFDRELGLEFVRRFGSVLVELGYEADNSWCDSLQERVADPHSPETPRGCGLDAVTRPEDLVLAAARLSGAVRSVRSEPVLSIEEWSFLDAASSQNGQRMNRIAQRLFMSHEQALQTARKLEAKGLVTLRIDETGKRKIVSVTETAAAAMKKIADGLALEFAAPAGADSSQLGAAVTLLDRLGAAYRQRAESADTRTRK